jgi:hypothetical protein
LSSTEEIGVERFWSLAKRAIIVNYLGISFSLPLLGAFWTLLIPTSGLPFLYITYRLRKFPSEDWKKELVCGAITLYVPLLIHGLIYWGGFWPPILSTSSPERILEVEMSSIPAPFIGVGLILGFRWIRKGIGKFFSRNKNESK